jgi:hypothetical protein
MSAIKPIESAPQDGTKIQVYWKDADGQENESIAQYRSASKLKSTGGDWDDSDTGWWTFVDSTTQKKIEPYGWSTGEGDE